MTYIEPIDINQQQQVITLTEEYITRAGQIYARSFDPVPVLFDLPGRTAGMYKIKRNKKMIRYNPWLFAKNFNEHLESTVPHEVAHYISDEIYGLDKIRPHGKEWQSVMAHFNADASVTGDYDLEGVPQRTLKRFAYRCACSLHELTVRRHNKITRRRAIYHCLKCGSELEYVRQEGLLAS
jgi:SprT protein